MHRKVQISPYFEVVFTAQIKTRSHSQKTILGLEQREVLVEPLSKLGPETLVTASTQCKVKKGCVHVRIASLQNEPVTLPVGRPIAVVTVLQP